MQMCEDIARYRAVGNRPALRFTIESAPGYDEFRVDTSRTIGREDFACTYDVGGHISREWIRVEFDGSNWTLRPHRDNLLPFRHMRSGAILPASTAIVSGDTFLFPSKRECDRLQCRTPALEVNPIRYHLVVVEAKARHACPYPGCNKAVIDLERHKERCPRRFFELVTSGSFVGAESKRKRMAREQADAREEATRKAEEKAEKAEKLQKSKGTTPTINQACEDDDWMDDKHPTTDPESRPLKHVFKSPD